MNSLNEELKDGDKVIMNSKIYNDKTCVFICGGGFGAESFTSGTALFGEWESDRKKDRVNSMHIVRRIEEAD